MSLARSFKAGFEYLQHFDGKPCQLAYPALKDRAKLIAPLRVEEMANETWKMENDS
jgi:hypothetical protein